MIIYADFYRRRGIRKLAQLTAPRLSTLDTFTLPLESMVHYFPATGAELGPNATDLFLQKVSAPVYANHHLELTGHAGAPRRNTSATGSQLISAYRKRVPQVLRMKELEYCLRNPRTVIYENYSLLNKLWKYPSHWLKRHWAWSNVFETFCARLNALALVTDRQQYFQFSLPQVLPEFTKLKLAESNLTRALLESYPDDDSFFLLEIFRWLGPFAETSLLNKLTPEALNCLNLVITVEGRYCILNLGLLRGWESSPSMESFDGRGMLDTVEDESDPTVITIQMEGEGWDDEDSVATEDAGVPARQMQKRFFALLHCLTAVRSLSAGVELTESVPVQPQETPAPVAVQLPEQTLVVKDPAKTNANAFDKALDDLLGNPSAKTIKAVIGDTKGELGKAVNALLPAGDSGSGDVTVPLTEDSALGITRDTTKVYKVAPPAFTDVIETPEADAIANDPVAGPVVETAKQLAKKGLLTPAEVKRFERLSTKYKTMRSPFSENQTLEEFAKVDPAVVHNVKPTPIPEIRTVFDKSMLKSSLIDFDRKYLKEVLHRDITNSILGIQQAGVAVTDYKVERVVDVLNKYDIHTVKLVPVVGSPSTFRFRLPVVEEDGTFQANGVKYHMRKQRGDLPIRKVAANRVALTSYYEKIFVQRSERKVVDYGSWLRNRLQVEILSDTPLITQARYGRGVSTKEPVPRVYSAIGQQFIGFQTAEWDLHFQYGTRHQHFGDEVVNRIEKQGLYCIGKSKRDRRFLALGKNNRVFEIDGGNVKETGELEPYLHIEAGSAPIEVAELKVFGKNIPVGFVLAYKHGFAKLVELLGQQPRRVAKGVRMDLAVDEYPIRFANETWIFRRTRGVEDLILAGLNTYKSYIDDYNVEDYDHPDVYMNVLEMAGLGIRYLREIDLEYKMFIDSITLEILNDLNLPNTFDGLLRKACELLVTDDHPDETDLAHMRIKGYERLAGAVYKEIVNAMRVHTARPVTARAPVDINPHAVWQAIQKDPSVSIVEESNPIHNLKEKEDVTFSGVGGRGKRSMVQRTRVFHPNDMGTISEATKDSADVAISTYLTADPKFTSLRGTTARYDPATDGLTNLLSTSAMISPEATHDDSKRVGFISIQQSHGIATKGYTPAPLRTGYETVIAHRTDPLFAYTAESDGRVTEVTDETVTIVYDATGETKTLQIGRRYGTVTGTTVPHTIVTPMRAGDVFKAGECIVYNTGFFAPDVFNKGQVVWKPGILARTAIMETEDTFEDSSCISERIADLFETKYTHIRNILVRFDQSVRNIVRIDDEIDPESILCTIEDPITARIDLFDETNLDTLRQLTNQTPRAKHEGVVEKIEIIYNGDIEDMSESLQSLAIDGDRTRARLARRLKQDVALSGRVSENVRMNAGTLEMDMLCIRIYITSVEGAGVGDKAVFGNQLKTVIGRVMTGINRTVQGEDIDAIFGAESIFNRIALSPVRMGTTNTLLRVVGKHVARVYRGKV